MQIPMRPRASSSALALAVPAVAVLGCSGTDYPSAERMRRDLASVVAVCGGASGDVAVKRAVNAFWEPASVGTPLMLGDYLRTRESSFARLIFLGGGGLELEDNALMAIEASAALEPGVGDAGEAAAPRPMVAVESGVVRGAIDPTREGAGPLLIKTAGGAPVRLAAAPGKTQMAFRLTGGKQGTEIALTEGAGTLGAQGAEKSLRSGQVAVVGTGGATEVAELIDFPASVAPGVDARLQWAPGLSVRLVWRRVPLAAGYRVQVARDLSFHSGLLTQDTVKTEMVWPLKSDGLHVWRVASRDPAGRVGENGFARRIFAEKEELKDFLVGPAEGAAFAAVDDAPAKVVFTWQAAADARLYRVVVARGDDLLRSVVFLEYTPTQRMEADSLGAGSYTWGVYVEGEPLKPIFLKPRRLTIRRIAKSTLQAPRELDAWGR